MKVVTTVKIKNNLGLHIRPAASIVKMLKNTKCDVTFTYKKESVNAKSIMGILMLALKKNSMITITINGPDADKVMDELTIAFENSFGEK
ncbi:MAG: Phosphocarrier protein HPr [Candidatus Anoxychlamydiales bacterium]|nr:Phosphocarrier protein HPr [Candidatus Anoxychlamydiales bacterium]